MDEGRGDFLVDVLVVRQHIISICAFVFIINYKSMESLKKNIDSQLERLLSQLTDLEEVKNDLSPEEYEEMKTDTLTQIEEFEGFLARQVKGDLALETITEAKRQIEDAKSKAFGVKELKEKFRGHEAEKIRDQIASLKIEASNGKLSKVAFS